MSMTHERFSDASIPENEKKSTGDALKKTLNATVAATIISGAAGMMPSEAVAQEKIAFANPAVSHTEENKTAKEDLVEKLDTSVLSYIAGLSIFGKLGLVNDIKNNGESIKTFLKERIHDTEKTKSIFGQSSNELKTVLSLYVRGLKEIEKTSPSAYASSISRINSLISTVQTSSISELEEKFK